MIMNCTIFLTERVVLNSKKSMKERKEREEKGGDGGKKGGGAGYEMFRVRGL